MTTLVALATKDALVLGCDSLGTRTSRLISPTRLLKYFDQGNKYQLKNGKDGTPLLKSFSDIWKESESVPSEHMTHMTKLFSLEPLKAGVLLTGITSIGDRTIRSIVGEFARTKTKAIRKKGYTVQDISEKVMEHILKYYDKEYTDEKNRPQLELIVGGYGKRDAIPSVYRIKLPGKDINKQLEPTHFGIVFGGQTKEIQRIVFGTDVGNKLNIGSRHIGLLRQYREKINKLLKEKGATLEVPDLTRDDIDALDIFSDNWDLEGFDSNWGDLSEQNAIECVDFFVNIMIKSQQFSTGMPTVGGEVHIALITKDKYKPISKEEYVHAGHYSPKHI